MVNLSSSFYKIGAKLKAPKHLISKKKIFLDRSKATFYHSILTKIFLKIHKNKGKKKSYLVNSENYRTNKKFLQYSYRMSTSIDLVRKYPKHQICFLIFGENTE